MAQLQERAVSTREAIVRAAATIFDQNGYADGSLDAVANEAGVTKGALYHHFKSKTEVANAVIALQHEIAQEYGARVFQLGETALERLIWMSQSFAQQMKEEVVVSAGVRLTTEAGAANLRRHAPYLDWIGAVRGQLEEAIREGDVRDDVDPAVVAEFLIPAYTGVQMVSDVLYERKNLFNQLESLWTLMIIPALVPSSRQAVAAAKAVSVMRQFD